MCIVQGMREVGLPTLNELSLATSVKLGLKNSTNPCEVPVSGCKWAILKDAWEPRGLKAQSRISAAEDIRIMDHRHMVMTELAI